MDSNHVLVRSRAWRRMFQVNLRPELKELYYFSLIFSFASALIAIFEPVFFYQQNFSLSFIALYYAFHYTIYIFLLPLGGKFASRFGLERSIAVSLPIFVMYMVTLAMIPWSRHLIWLAIPLLTIHKIFYWPAYHADFAKFGDAKNRGTELSFMRLLQFGVGILGPLTGGFIAATLGFPTLFMIGALLVLVSAGPLLATKERYRRTEFTYSTPWKIIRSRQHRNMVLGMAGWGENLIDLVFWPIFIFIILGSTELLGVIASLTVALMTLTSFFVGEMTDRFPRRYILRLHLPFMVLGHLMRPLAVTPLGVLLTDSVARISLGGVHIPAIYRLYKQGVRAGILRYTVAFEISLAIAKALLAFILAAVFALALPYTGFVITFILAAVFALLYLFI